MYIIDFINFIFLIFTISADVSGLPYADCFKPHWHFLRLYTCLFIFFYMPIKFFHIFSYFAHFCCCLVILMHASQFFVSIKV